MDIPLSSDALDIAHHPGDNVHLLATGLISGKIQLIDYGRAAAQSGGTALERRHDAAVRDPGAKGQASSSAKLYSKRWTVRPGSKSCRGVAFNQDGSALWSLSKDGAIIQLETETSDIVSHWKGAHDAAPSRVLPIERNLLATGDDDGVIKLWDPRRNAKTSEGIVAPVATYEHHFDWITSMLWCPHLIAPRQAKPTKEELERKKRNEEKKRRKRERRKAHQTYSSTAGNEDDDDDDDDDDATSPQVATTQRERLVCTSGDGTLSVIDVRASTSKKGHADVSEDQEDELLSLAPVKRNTKLVVGTQQGILSLWAPSRGLLDHVDRIPGHPASVDTICTLDDDTVLTGSSDGLVRVVQIMPHALLGIVADHGGMPVERIARHGNWLASIGHGPEVKLTDLAPILEGEDDEEDEDDKDDDRDEGRDVLVAEPSRRGSNSSEGSDEDAAEKGISSTSVESVSRSRPDTSDAGSRSENSDEDNATSDYKRPQPRKKARTGITPLSAASVVGSAPATGAANDFFADL